MKAHKFVLWNASEVLKQQLLESKDVITFPCKSAHLIKKILSFVYLKAVEVTKDELAELKELAFILGLDILVQLINDAVPQESEIFIFLFFSYFLKHILLFVKMFLFRSQNLVNSLTLPFLSKVVSSKYTKVLYKKNPK